MNSSSGHLVRDIEQVFKDDRDAYSRLPATLSDDAAMALDGADETYIDLGKRTALAQWAAKDRRERRERQKREKRNKQQARRRR